MNVGSRPVAKELDVRSFNIWPWEVEGEEPTSGSGDESVAVVGVRSG